MMQILMTLMMSLAPAKAEIVTQVQRDISTEASSCLLVVTRVELTGSIDLYCTSERTLATERQELLVLRFGGSNPGIAETIDQLEGRRAGIIQALGDAGFLTDNATCEPTRLVFPKAQVTTVRTIVPESTIRTCTFTR